MARLTTSPASAKSRHKQRRHQPPGSNSRSAFTLIELLVAIVIIGVLASILIPALASSYRSAKRTREANDLQSIAAALEAYYGEFHAYPQVDHPILVYPQGAPNTWGTTGADVLGWALVGPGPAIQDGYGDPTGANANLPGPGFRTVTNGKIHQPLLPTDTGFVGPQPGPTCILDKQYTRPLDVTGAAAGNAVMKAGAHPPILYYRANPAKLNINQANSFVTNQLNAVAQFNYLDNNNEVDLTFEAFKKILGDTNANGQIDPGENPASTGPYLLWSVGPDGKFGIDPLTLKTDDVTNFDIPVDLRK